MARQDGKSPFAVGKCIFIHGPCFSHISWLMRLHKNLIRPDSGTTGDLSLSRWWLNHPVEKTYSSNFMTFPQFQRWKFQKCLKNSTKFFSPWLWRWGIWISLIYQKASSFFVFFDGTKRRSLHHKISQVWIITILSRIWCAARALLGRLQLYNHNYPKSFLIPSWELTYPHPAGIFESMIFLFPRWYVSNFFPGG